MEDNIREARAALQSGFLLVINVCECEPELDGSPLNTGGHMQTLVKNAQTPHTVGEINSSSVRVVSVYMGCICSGIALLQNFRPC